LNGRSELVVFDTVFGGVGGKGLKAVTLSSAEKIMGREAAQSILIDVVNEAGATFICDETKEFINE
jgi:hypothetical protein